MKVVFLKGFEKEIAKITDRKLASSIDQFIRSVEYASGLRVIPNLKKLKGHPSAYRFRIGNYRIGFYFSNEVVTFAAIGDCKDIYKKFP